MSGNLYGLAKRDNRDEAGFSLVELMVAMAIGLIVVMLVGQLFLNTRQTYLTQDANSRLQENARYVTDFIGRQLRMAGYAEADFSIISGNDVWATPPSFSFSGTPIAGVDGGDSAHDSMTVSFDADVDCLGNTITLAAVNEFRINASNQLECVSGGASTVILDDVESMQIGYRQEGSTTYEAASAVNMANVSSVRICLLMRARAELGANVTDSNLAQSYFDCVEEETKTGSDGYLRWGATMTVALRNRMR